MAKTQKLDLATIAIGIIIVLLVIWFIMKISGG